MIVRLRTLEFVNLDGTTHGETLPDGGMRIYIRDAQPYDLPPDDADRVRRRVRDIDPEPLPGERPGPKAAPPGRIEMTGEGAIREKSPRRVRSTHRGKRSG